jgi:peptidoglycan hydrolase CwlO-like protein
MAQLQPEDKQIEGTEVMIQEHTARIKKTRANLKALEQLYLKEFKKHMGSFTMPE